MKMTVLGRQHGRRLVDDKDPRFAVEGLEDLDSLLLDHRQLPDAPARMDVQPVPGAEVGDLALDRSPPEEECAALAPVIAQDDVLGDREGGDEAEVLMHHADARVQRVAR